MRTRITSIILVFGVMALAFFLRVAGQIPVVFVNGQVIFREVDPYYHMRLAENMAMNFPHFLKFDYMAQYPDGAVVGYGSVLSAIIATISQIIGLGRPSVALVDMVGAWIPPIAACAVCLVVYFIGKEVFKSRFVGIFGGILVATLPTEFMHRSLLGFTDHHVLEVLFAVMTILFLIKVLNHKSLLWGLAAAASFVLYVLNWIGWPIFLFIIVIWAYFHFGLKYVKQKWLLFIPVASVIGITIINPTLHTWAVAFASNTFMGAFGTIQEAKPIEPVIFYTLYGLGGILAFIGIFLAIRNKINSLFLVFSAFWLITMLCEKRWGYYGTIPVALLAAYLIYWIGQHAAKDWKPYMLTFCCITTMFTTGFYEIGFMHTPNNISPQWYNACIWLRDNTPSPYSDPNAYFKENPGKAGYGVLSWWDYGSWILQIGKRVPVSSPTQQESIYHGFFTASSEQEANKVISGLNIQYLMLDKDTVGDKFYAIWDKVKGTPEGWQQGLQDSFVYKLYNNQPANTWQLVHVEGDVKIYQRIGG